MKVILLSDIPNLGKKNQVVEVNDGYGKNFLLKTKRAIVYTETSANVLSNQIEKQNDDYAKEVYEANLFKQKLESKDYVFYLKANHGNAYGHISAKELIDKINEEEKLVNKYMLKKEHEWGLGPHRVEFSVHKDVIAIIKINVMEQK